MTALYWSAVIFYGIFRMNYKWLNIISAHHHSLIQNVPLHCKMQIIKTESRFQVKFGIKCIHNKLVTM